jgi:hypothetical protein
MVFFFLVDKVKIVVWCVCMHVYETRMECMLKESEDGMLRRLHDIKNVILF